VGPREAKQRVKRRPGRVQSRRLSARKGHGKDANGNSPLSYHHCPSRPTVVGKIGRLDASRSI
jgi:hypothetical protein